MKLFNQMSKEEKLKVGSKIQFNISEEAKASEFYFELKQIISEEDEKIIDEIIGDELDHAITLARLQEKYTNVFPNSYFKLTSLPRKEQK